MAQTLELTGCDVMTGVDPQTPRSTQVVDGEVRPEQPVRSESVAWAEMVLLGQEMPPDELRVVLTSSDGDLVHRYLELHLERLEEWLFMQRQAVTEVERILADAAGEPDTEAHPR